MLVSVKTQKIVLNLRDPARVTTVIPTAKAFAYKGATLVAVPHRVEEVRVLRNLGFPAPSPITKPSRSLSKGRLALSGSSFRVESAFMAENPAIAKGITVDSVAPATITSALPMRMMSAASPSAWLPVAQAVTRQRFGPISPWRSAT